MDALDHELHWSCLLRWTVNEDVLTAAIPTTDKTFGLEISFTVARHRVLFLVWQLGNGCCRTSWTDHSSEKGQGRRSFGKVHERWPPGGLSTLVRSWTLSCDAVFRWETHTHTTVSLSLFLTEYCLTREVQSNKHAHLVHRCRSWVDNLGKICRVCWKLRRGDRANPWEYISRQFSSYVHPWQVGDWHSACCWLFLGGSGFVVMSDSLLFPPDSGLHLVSFSAPAICSTMCAKTAWCIFALRTTWVLCTGLGVRTVEAVWRVNAPAYGSRLANGPQYHECQNGAGSLGGCLVHQSGTWRPSGTGGF